MKKFYVYLTAIFIISINSSCRKDFLSRYPTTEITGERFFNTVNDLKTYTNGFYDYLSTPVTDYGSDNLAHHNSGSEFDNLLRGNISPVNVGGWNWGQLRNINYFLENYSKATGNATDINHYVGIARLFRALFYIDKVQRYGDVPWYDKTLNTDDEALTKAKDPRAFVVEKIMEDFDFAKKNILSGGHKSRINRESAIALLARFALYEGTFRKYHTELNLEHATEFLTVAANSAGEIMKTNLFALHATGNVDKDYRSIFISENLNNNSEIILYKDYDFDLNQTHQGGVVLDYEWAFSRNFADSYLMKDGSRFTDVPGNERMTLPEVFNNRDPRMAQTIMKPGFKNPGANEVYRLKPTLGGYNQIKFYPEEPNKIGWYMSYNDLPLIRYAEILLIYAEAKAELGTLNQSDLDQSVNEIRKRAGMPFLNMEQANASPDLFLLNYYHNEPSLNTGVILEIRRERNIELVAEGFRIQDLYRWKEGEVLENLPQGMYVPALGEMDVTGDGSPDIAILNKPGEEAPISDLPEEIKKSLSLYYLKDSEGRPSSIYLQHGSYGHIMFTQDLQAPKKFLEKYYYWPIPKTQLLLNSNLSQSRGWE